MCRFSGFARSSEHAAPSSKPFAESVTVCGRNSLRRSQSLRALLPPLFGAFGAIALVAVIATFLLAHHQEFGASLLIVLASVLLSTIFASLFLVRVVRRFELPLHGINEVAARYGEGDFEISPYLGLDFKFPEVAEALTRMGERLKNKIEVLTRQRNEQKAIFAGMVEAVIVLNPSLEIVETNPAAAELMGVTPAAAKGRSLIDLIRNPDLHTFAKVTLESGETREGMIRLSGDTTHHLQVHGSVIRRDRETGSVPQDESTERLVLVLHDITELKNLERIRKDFVANVSHELKTPITAIKGFIETLEDGAISDPPTASRFLSIMEKQTERMEAIIEDLLSLSRLELYEGRLATIASFDVGQVIASSKELVSESAAKRHVEITAECPDSITATGNPSLIEQALVNLLDNAIKFSPEGGRVHVTAFLDAGCIRLSVRDEGIGIPVKDQPRIFERFYRVDRARSRELGGTGLGLAIVKHIALAHGGEVNVDSTVGVGSTFTLILPLRQGEDPGLS